MIQKLMNMFLVIFVFSAFNISAQTTTVTGTITDSSDGMELPSVTVQAVSYTHLTLPTMVQV